MLTPTESQRLLEQVIKQVNDAFEKDRKKFARLEERVKELEEKIENENPSQEPKTRRKAS